MNIRWVFNPMMIYGAVFGFLIFGGLGQIRDTWKHQGPGYVTYEEPDREERVPESEYKNHQYTMGGMMLAIGVLFWVIVAKPSQNNTANKPIGDE